jgi:succinate dehydrogenase / fumarate reductase cytochrome b subunit
MIQNILNGAKGYLIYKGGMNHVSFIIHRVSGIATLMFLSMHILLESTVYYAPQLYDSLNGMLRIRAVMISEIILAFFVIYHSVNGFRIAYLDLFHPESWTLPTGTKLALSVWSVSFILWLPAALIMLQGLSR